MYRSEWLNFDLVDQVFFANTRDQFHHAVQFISVIGRKFSTQGVRERAAALTWVPGYKRLASNWVDGQIPFRVSLSFEDFSVYIVDTKVNTVDHLSLQNQSQSQILLWLEEQIAKMGLDATGLTMNLPYEIPEFETLDGEPFDVEKLYMYELSKYFQNTYYALKFLAENLGLQELKIRVWPKRFDMAMTVLVKETGEEETNSSLVTGMSFGIESISEPFFYIRSKPHVDIGALTNLQQGMEWYADETWTGAVLKSSELLKSSDQFAFLNAFYAEASSTLIKKLEA